VCLPHRRANRGAVASELADASWLLLLPVPTWMRGLATGGTGVASGLLFPQFFCDHPAGVNGGKPRSDGS
jgi:hypothetical protein